MKHALSLTLAALLSTPASLPLLAGEPKKAAEPQQQEQPKTTDSPLVDAAKRGRTSRAKKSVVITNESLKSSKGHVTTTTVEAAPVVAEPVLGPEAKLIAEKKRNEAAMKAREAQLAEEKKAAEEKRAKAREAYGSQVEEGIYEDDDPAAVERAAEDSQSQKPPM